MVLDAMLKCLANISSAWLHKKSRDSNKFHPMMYVFCIWQQMTKETYFSAYQHGHLNRNKTTWTIGKRPIPMPPIKMNRLVTYAAVSDTQILSIVWRGAHLSIQVSTMLAAGVVVSAFYQRPNFYSACVYLAQSNLCLMVGVPQS